MLPYLAVFSSSFKPVFCVLIRLSFSIRNSSCYLEASVFIIPLLRIHCSLRFSKFTVSMNNLQITANIY